MKRLLVESKQQSQRSECVVKLCFSSLPLTVLFRRHPLRNSRHPLRQPAPATRYAFFCTFWTYHLPFNQTSWSRPQRRSPQPTSPSPPPTRSLRAHKARPPPTVPLDYPFTFGADENQPTHLTPFPSGVGLKRRHAMITMLDPTASSSSSPLGHASGGRRRTRSSAMDIEEDDRPRKRR